jgi:hypothetical protein
MTANARTVIESAGDSRELFVPAGVRLLGKSSKTKFRTAILTGMTSRLAGALFPTFLWLLAGFSFSGAYAETNTGPRFDVASIKLSAPAARNTSIFFPPGGRLEVINMSLKEMIANAYSIQPFQISSGPGWLDSAHYDISAKAEAARKQDDVLVRLQSLLTERFHVAFRRETHDTDLQNSSRK